MPSRSRSKPPPAQRPKAKEEPSSWSSWWGNEEANEELESAESDGGWFGWWGELVGAEAPDTPEVPEWAGRAAEVAEDPAAAVQTLAPGGGALAGGLADEAGGLTSAAGALAALPEAVTAPVDAVSSALSGSASFGWSFAPSLEIPLPMGLVASLSARVALDGALHSHTDGASLQVAADAHALAAGAVGLGAGLAGIASAGVSGQVSVEGAAHAEASLGAAADLEGGAVSGDLEVTAALTGAVSITPWLDLSVIGQRFEWPVELGAWTFAHWHPTLVVRVGTDGPDLVDVRGADALELDVPDALEGGMVGDLLGWFGEDDQAAATVAQLKADGLLDRMAPDERAQLVAAMMDGAVLDAHEGAILDVLASERSVDDRWALAIRSWEAEHGRPGEGTRDAALAWLESSIQDGWFGFGEDNATRLHALLGVG